MLGGKLPGLQANRTHDLDLHIFEHLVVGSVVLDHPDLAFLPPLFGMHPATELWAGASAQ